MHRSVAVFVGALALVACSDPPPPKVAPKVATPKKKTQTMTVEGERGGLNQEAMERGFASLQNAVVDCVNDASEGLDVLGGALTVSLRVGTDGHAQWAYLKKSTLGHRRAERCVLALMLDRQWPKPVGGEGEAEMSYQVDPIRDPIEVEPQHLKPVLKSVLKATVGCRKQMSGRYELTGYLHPNGKVLAAGVAPSTEKGEEASDCITEATEKLRFGKIGSKPAKFTVNFQ